MVSVSVTTCPALNWPLDGVSVIEVRTAPAVEPIVWLKAVDAGLT
jgi:hypothetical protein